MSAATFRRAAKAAVVLCLALPAVAAASTCKSYSGPFTAVKPAVCSSPFGICTHGTLTGGFPSTYDFTVDTLDFTTGAYTGHSVITDAHGAQIFGSDSGTLVPNGDGTADFVTTVNIVGGTRRYKHVTGQFVAPGTLNLITGDTTGTYSATICRAGDDEDDDS